MAKPKQTHCCRGHELTEENRGAEGRCKACDRERWHERQHRSGGEGKGGNMYNQQLQDIAYEMENAYTKEGNRMGDAVHQVGLKFPNASVDLLRGMWFAIDAYVDMNS